MKKILTNYRYYVLFVLITLSIMGILAVPIDDQQLSNWLFYNISSKVIGFGIGWIVYKLTKRWEKQGKIKELTAFTKDF